MSPSEHHSQRARVTGSLESTHHPDVFPTRRRRPVSVEVHMPDGISPHDLTKAAAQIARAAELTIGHTVEVQIHGIGGTA